MRKLKEEINKADLALFVLALRDMNLKRHEINDVLEEVYRLREWTSDRVLIEEVHSCFGNVIEEAKTNYENEVNDKEMIEETEEDDREQPMIIDLPYYPISCKVCYDEIEGKGIKYKFETYCPDCALDNQLIDYDLRDKLVYDN